MDTRNINNDRNEPNNHTSDQSIAKFGPSCRLANQKQATCPANPLTQLPNAVEIKMDDPMPRIEENPDSSLTVRAVVDSLTSPAKIRLYSNPNVVVVVEAIKSELDTDQHVEPLLVDTGEVVPLAQTQETIPEEDFTDDFSMRAMKSDCSFLKQKQIEVERCSQGVLTDNTMGIPFGDPYVRTVTLIRNEYFWLRRGTAWLLALGIVLLMAVIAYIVFYLASCPEQDQNYYNTTSATTDHSQ